MPLAHVDLPIPRAPLESGSTRARRLSRSLSPERNQILNLALTRLPPLDNGLTPKPPPCLEPTDPCQLIMRDAPVLSASSTPKSSAIHSPVSLPNAVAHEKLGAPERPSQARPLPASSANGSASGARFRRFSAPTAANNSRPVELASTLAVRRDRESA
ncbi:hypothetical protein BCR44DRAFT_1424087 [Catenaria anguillulae PL171]|uniref:Uncharacterized protein n=1 Tax=Catenaria anguillulae PL171 TaxID=765915 RepID=A0A1Y2I400_9FUNG|nr:hypothetical protein BCR44DRAFT_1424087 [Catenaria anguillulae PL171]